MSASTDALSAFLRGAQLALDIYRAAAESHEDDKDSDNGSTS